MKGKICLVTGATAGIGKITGKYFVKREAVQSAPISYDEKTAHRLWDISKMLTAQS